MSRARRLRGLLGALLLVAAVAAAAQGVYPGIAARVNGVEISNQRWQDAYRELLAARNVNIVVQRTPGRMEEVRRETLDMLIEQELAWQAARAAGITADEAEVDRGVAELRARFAAPGAFERKLAGDGFTLESFRQNVRRIASARRYLDGVADAAAAGIGDAEVEAFYRANPERLTLPEQVRARYIVRRVGVAAGAEERAAERRQLEALRAQVTSAADFAALARRHSQDATAGAGGDLGLITRGRIEKPAEDAAFALAPGRVSAVVESPESLFLVFVEEHLPARLLPLDEVRTQLADHLRAERRRQAIADELDRLRREAKVEVLAQRP